MKRSNKKECLRLAFEDTKADPFCLIKMDLLTGTLMTRGDCNCCFTITTSAHGSALNMRTNEKRGASMISDAYHRSCSAFTMYYLSAN